MPKSSNALAELLREQAGVLHDEARKRRHALILNEGPVDVEIVLLDAADELHKAARMLERGK